ncbi:MAG: cytochrome b N-terminal domain-containing protein, partial [Anaerolineales bacterium]|nr:cytochrome b N-terminal domain-containing protein [Anaerolineales bacterium]
SLWAVTIGASMAEAIQPQFIGDFVNLIVRGGPQFNEGGLLRWYLAHVLLLPLVGIIFTGVHYYKVVLHGHGLPPEVEPVGEDTAKRVPLDQRTYFMPDILTRELLLFFAVTAAMVVIATFFFHAPLEPHADPLVTPLHTTAPWYFLWIQGMLKIGDKFFWGVIAPGIAFGILFVLPYLEVGPSRRYADRRVGLSLGLAAIALLAILSYMGTPHYAVASSIDQEIVAELIPQTHPGPFRQSEWGEFRTAPKTADNPTGRAIYAAADYASAPTPALRELLGQMEHELELAREKAERGLKAEQGALPNGQGFLIIEEWQVGLKKVTFRVIWNEGPGEAVCATGAKNEFCQTTYIHKNSNYRQGP